MANVINMGGSGANIESKTVKSSQTQQTITPPDGVDGFNPVVVSPFVLQSKTVSPINAQQVIKPDTGKDGLSQVTVNAMKLQSKTASPSTNQQIIRSDSNYNGLSQVTVNAASLQSKTVTPSQQAQTITPDSGYIGFSSVTVNGLDPIVTLTGTFTGAGTFNPSVLDVSSQVGSFTSISVLSCAVRFTNIVTQESLVFLCGDNYGCMCYTVDSAGTPSVNSGDMGYRVNGTVEGTLLYLLIQHPYIGAQVVFGRGNTYQYQVICYVNR